MLQISTARVRPRMGVCIAVVNANKPGACGATGGATKRRKGEEARGNESAGKGKKGSDVRGRSVLQAGLHIGLVVVDKCRLGHIFDLSIMTGQSRLVLGDRHVFRTSHRGIAELGGRESNWQVSVR